MSLALNTNVLPVGDPKTICKLSISLFPVKDVRNNKMHQTDMQNILTSGHTKSKCIFTYFSVPQINQEEPEMAKGSKTLKETLTCSPNTEHVWISSEECFQIDCHLNQRGERRKVPVLNH